MPEPDIIVEADFASSVIFFLCQQPAGMCWMHFVLESKLLICLGLLSSHISDWMKGGNCWPLQALVHHFQKFAKELIDNIISMLPGACSECLLLRW